MSQLAKSSKNIVRINVQDVDVRRESIFLTESGHTLPMNQVMSKYIPKEPVKACVASPVRPRASSPGSSVAMCSETEGSEYTLQSPSLSRVSSVGQIQQSAATKKKSSKKKHRKTERSDHVITRPVNVVGPLQPTNHSNDESDSEGSTEFNNNALQRRVTEQDSIITQLRVELDSQFKVNSELKKLLVASVGNDLEYRVEKLAQDKAQLSATVGSYSEKIYQDVEDLDRVSIQADMWRSKFLASRLQAEELAQYKDFITDKYQEAASALQAMIEERLRVQANLHTTCKLLKQMLNQPELLSAPPINTESLSQETLLLTTQYIQSLTKEQSLHSDKTTHEQSLHSNKTTHQQSLHNDKTTHQQSLHSGKTTHEQSLHSDKTAHEQSLHSDKTTHEQSHPNITTEASMYRARCWTAAESQAYNVLARQVIPENTLSVPQHENIPRLSSSTALTRCPDTALPNCWCGSCKGKVHVI